MKKKILISAAFLLCATEYSFASNNNPFKNFEEKNLPPKSFKQTSVSKNNFAKNLKFFENRDVTDNNVVKPSPKKAPEKKALVKKPVKKIVKNYQPVVYTLDKLPKPIIGMIMENLDSKSFAKFARTSKFFSTQAKGYFNGLIGDRSDSEHVKNFLFTANDAFSKLNQTENQKKINLLSSNSEQVFSFYKVFEKKALQDQNFKFLLETAVHLPFSKEAQKTAIRRFGYRLAENGFYAPFFNATSIEQKLPEEKLKTLFWDYFCGDFIAFGGEPFHDRGMNFIMFPLVFNVFLEKGMHIDTCELNEGYTPLGYLVQHGINLSNIEFLLKKGANINLKDNGELCQSSPLNMACTRYDNNKYNFENLKVCLSIIDLLLKNGANMKERVSEYLIGDNITIIQYIHNLNHKNESIKNVFKKYEN